VAYQVQLTAEVENWLTDLRERDLGSAMRAGAGITALLMESEFPEASSVAPTPRLAGEDPRQDLDETYQILLEMLTRVRRQVADVATSRKRTQLQLAQAEAAEQADQADDLRRLEAELAHDEERVTGESQRLQAWVDSFRTRKESLKAAYTAAEGLRTANEALRGLGAEHGDKDGAQVSPADADEALARARSAAEEYAAIGRDLARELGNQPAPDSDAQGDNAGGAEPDSPRLWELRAGLLAGQPSRILFSVSAAEEPGAMSTALLLAVGPDHSDLDSGDDPLLEVARTRYEAATSAELGEGRPDSYDKDDFLDRFFPGEQADVEDAAIALLAANEPQPLAEVRRRAGLTRPQVAELMGVPQDRVSALERADVGSAEVRTLAAYIEALGGRLEIVADFGADRVFLG
jgi:phage shock protein A